MHYSGKNANNECDHPGMSCDLFRRMIDNRHKAGGDEPGPPSGVQLVRKFRERLGFAAPEMQEQKWEEFERLIDERLSAVQKQPLLGLATTRQLLEELKARGEMTKYGNPAHEPHGDRLARRAEKLLGYLPQEMLDYRTTDDE